MVLGNSRKRTLSRTHGNLPDCCALAQNEKQLSVSRGTSVAKSASPHFTDSLLEMERESRAIPT